MSTSSPSEPSLWRALLLGGAAAAGVGVILVWLMTDEPAATPTPEGMVADEDGNLVDQRVWFEADRESRRQAALPKTGASLILSTFEGAGPGVAPLSDLQAARDGFELVISEIELKAESPRALKQREWREYYRAANDSFSALSAQLNGKDPQQAKELEEAHAKLVTALSIVRVRGGKFRIH